MSKVDAVRAEPIGLKLTGTAKVVSRAFDEALAEVGGTLPVWLILRSLKGRQFGAQRQIAAEVGIEGPTLTHHLNRLEDRGLVIRTRPDNRRTQRVELTEAGEAAFFQMLDAVRAFDRRLRAGFTGTELAVLDEVLTKVRNNLGDGKGK
jgi:MarR family transcriptional regulator, transcriptional regulator for hemolysin